MTMPKTLLQLAGANLAPARVQDACLLLIDLQNEYLEGPIALPEARSAIASAERILRAARAAAAPVLHVAHRGPAGNLFDRDAARGQIVSALSPLNGEPVVEKGLPNAFARTDLGTLIAATGRRDLVLVGFMTHMCVSSTARAALDSGYRVTIAADACATRDLPDGRGNVLRAALIHDIALAELSDRFAAIAYDSNDVM
jgi:nicotinamidase-related amidase